MIEKWYEVTCDYCGCVINHFIGRRPTDAMRLRKLGAIQRPQNSSVTTNVSLIGITTSRRKSTLICSKTGKYTQAIKKLKNFHCSMKNFFYICGVKATKYILLALSAPIWIPLALITGLFVSILHFVASKRYNIPFK